MRLNIQLTDVVMPTQRALAQPGYSSLLMVHGIGPMPACVEDKCSIKCTNNVITINNSLKTEN